MALDLIEDAVGDYRNAKALGVASELAYLPQTEGAAAYREQLGLDARLISVGNTQVFLATNDNHVVAAFRGTEDPTTLEGIKDWLLTDAVNLLIVPEGQIGTDFAAAGVGARFHQGFMTALASVWDPLAAGVEAEMKKKERPLWVTGHSLGGALALLAAWRFQRKFQAVHQVYTYGGPMVGNAKAVEAIDREFPDKIFRFAHVVDPVPKLPTSSLIGNDYGHCQKEMALGTAAAGASSTLEFFQQMAARTVNGLLTATLMDDIWNYLKGRVTAHLMPNYQNGIDEKAKGG
jgi:predicted lipase